MDQSNYILVIIFIFILKKIAAVGILDGRVAYVKYLESNSLIFKQKLYPDEEKGSN